MLARVSALEEFRRWRCDEESTPDDLVARLSSFEPSEPMRAGSAFHYALETAAPGEHQFLEADGYRFELADAELELPDIRELRAFGVYGPLSVTGCIDALLGLRVDDHKTTGHFDPERYLDGYQWRFYLDLFDANVFRWNVFEIREVEPRLYYVKPPQILEACRYPSMHADCCALAVDFHAFAARHMPAFIPMIQARV